MRKRDATVVAIAAPLMPIIGTRIMLNPISITVPTIRTYMGSLGFPSPWAMLEEMVYSVKKSIPAASICNDTDPGIYAFPNSRVIIGVAKTIVPTHSGITTNET
jgi:hypothetical protein